MKLESIKIVGFRGIPTLELEFPKQVNALVGVNGAGKSTVLDCIAIMLSRLISRISSSTGAGGRLFTVSDINNDASETRNEIEISFQGKRLPWRVSKTRRDRRKKKIKGLGALKTQVELFRSKLEKDETASLPVVVYYPVNRAVLDIPLRIRKRHPFDRLSAYDQALSGGWSSFRIFFEWFREREDLENEMRLDKPRFRDPQLQAVRSAIERFPPGFKGLRVRRSPLRMVVDKNRKELLVNQLSDGEKCTLAMAGDLARRMAIANPGLEDRLKGEGVVLIDEIDLHLHPAGQRHLVPVLKETFPNCQFLLSTHSPPVLSHLDRESIWILKRTRSGLSAKRPDDAYGQTAGRILEDIMLVPARPQEIQDQLTSLFSAIEQKRMTDAKQLLSEMRGKIGTDPDLVKANFLIQRMEVLGK